MCKADFSASHFHFLLYDLIPVDKINTNSSSSRRSQTGQLVNIISSYLVLAKLLDCSAYLSRKRSVNVPFSAYNVQIQDLATLQRRNEKAEFQTEQVQICLYSVANSLVSN